MTNYDHIKSLSPKEMAWFLMAYSDPCRTCIYKTKDYVNESHRERGLWSIRCVRPDIKGCCIKGTEAWLNRKTMEDEDDMFIFTACKRSVAVSEYNAIIEAEEEMRKRNQEEEWNREE